jgi:hypothetical protein
MNHLKTRRCHPSGRAWWGAEGEVENGGGPAIPIFAPTRWPRICRRLRLLSEQAHCLRLLVDAPVVDVATNETTDKPDDVPDKTTGARTLQLATDMQKPRKLSSHPMLFHIWKLCTAYHLAENCVPTGSDRPVVRWR